MKGLRSVGKETIFVGGLEPFSSTSMSILLAQISMRVQFVGPKEIADYDALPRVNDKKEALRARLQNSG